MTTLSHNAPLSSRGNYLRELWNRREFAWFLAMGNLQARNASTALGLFWWVLNPLLLAGVYYLVFGVIFLRGEQPNYLSYLLSGIFVFTFTSISMTTGANSILANSKLLANIRFPRLILPISAIIEAGVGFLASLVVFFVIAIPVDGVFPTPLLVLVVPVLVLQTGFNLGLASITARMAVPFRDVNNLIPYVVRLWLYLSPIIWPLTLLETMPTWAQSVAKLNPMFSFLSVYRSALLGTSPDWTMLATAAGWALVAAGLGVYFFVRYEGHMVRHL